MRRRYPAVRLTGPVRHLFRSDPLMTGCFIFFLLWQIISFRHAGPLRTCSPAGSRFPSASRESGALAAIIQGPADWMPQVPSFQPGHPHSEAPTSAELLLFGGTALHHQVAAEFFLFVSRMALDFLKGKTCALLTPSSGPGQSILSAITLLFPTVVWLLSVVPQRISCKRC